MEKLFTIIGAAIVDAGLLILVVLLGTIGGAFVGWIVGFFFEDTILGIAACLGITGFKMWQVGAFLGFAGGFLRPNVTKKKEE